MGYSEMSGLELFQMPFCNHAARQTQASGQPGPAKQKAVENLQASQTQPGRQAAAKQPKTQEPAGQDAKPAAATKNPDSGPSHLLAENECASTASAPEGHAGVQGGKGQAAVSKKPAQGQKPQAVPEMAKPLENTKEQPEIQEKELVLDMSPGPVADGNGKSCNADDAARRKAHEAAEAKRKAEWEEAKQAKKQAEALALQKLQSMSDDEAVAASTRRIRTDVERITRRNMKECVAGHIQGLCQKDPAFARLTMHPKKSMVNCFKYINRQANGYVRQEMEDNGMEPDNGGYGCDVPDGLCYQWAEDYFNDPDAPEDQKKEEKFVPKPYGGAASKPKKAASRPKKAAKPAEKGSKKQEPDNSFEQMSLF